MHAADRMSSDDDCHQSRCDTDLGACVQCFSHSDCELSTGGYCVIVPEGLGGSQNVACTHSATFSVSRRTPPRSGQEGVRSTGWPRRIESTVGADARRRAGRRIERRSSPFDERLLSGSPPRVHPGGTWQPADTGSDLSRGCNYRRPRPLLCTGPGGASRWGHQLNPRTPHRWCTSRSRQIGSLLSRRRHRPVSRRI